jgi:hypothetical protein
VPEAPGTGISEVHVTSAAAQRMGLSGVSWTATFLAPLGNLPTLKVNATNFTAGFVEVHRVHVCERAGNVKAGHAAEHSISARD